MGKVVGVEHIPELVEWSKENLRRDGLDQALQNGTIHLFAGDGRKGKLLSVSSFMLNCHNSRLPRRRTI